MTYSDILFQLQQDCVDLINSEAIFQYNAGVAYRKAVMSQEISRRVPHLAAKNGRMGCSILVMQPMVEGADPNISTPQGDVLLPFHIMAKSPEINMAAGGTQISSEQIAMEIRAISTSAASAARSSCCRTIGPSSRSPGSSANTRLRRLPGDDARPPGGSVLSPGGHAADVRGQRRRHHPHLRHIRRRHLLYD